MSLMARVEYDGTAYYGWQIQPGRPTVQGKILTALERLYRRSVPIRYTSRTDRGVHARAQVISYTPPFHIPLSRVPKALNRLLPDDINIYGVEKCPDDFNPRYGIRSKMYAYRIFTGDRPPYTLRRFIWHTPGRMSAARAARAARILKGAHDFRAFSSSPPEKDTVIRIISSTFTSDGDMHEFRIRAPFFRTYMVRRLTGFIAAVGTGRKSCRDLSEMLNSAGPCPYRAPAKGLELRRVYFRGPGREGGSG